MDHFINRKKPTTKNSIKLKKFLGCFMAKGFEEIQNNPFLSFISVKHKIPIKAITKPPKLQTGFVLMFLFRRKQTFERSESTTATATASRPWGSPSTTRSRSSPTRTNWSSPVQSTRQTYLSRKRTASRRGHKGRATCCRRRRSRSLWGRTNDRSSRCRGTWQG